MSKAAVRYDKLLYQHTRPTLFLTPQDFLAAAVEYFKWCLDNPLREEKLFHHQGEIVRGGIKKVRAFTKAGLAQHLGIPVQRLDGYKLRVDAAWGEMMLLIEEAIYTQKFENAAAGLLNATIISRDLGLAEKQELTGADGGPIKTEEVSVRERISSKLASLASKERAAGDISKSE